MWAAAVSCWDRTPWLITAIDRVDMFYLWRMLKSVTSTPIRIEVALSNLIRHYSSSTSVAFVEHFLTLGVPISQQNINFLAATNAHTRLCFLQYIDSDGDGAVCDTDLVSTLQIPLAAARAILCRLMSVPIPPLELKRKFDAPVLTPSALYQRLGCGSLTLKRLVIAAGAHWLYNGAQKTGQCYRFFGLSGLQAILTPFLHIEDMAALATTCHDCNSVATLGMFWKTINVDNPKFPLDR